MIFLFFILVFLILKNLNKIRLHGFTTGKLLHDKAAAKSSCPVLFSVTSYKLMSHFYGDMSILAAKNWPVTVGPTRWYFFMYRWVNNVYPVFETALLACRNWIVLHVYKGMSSFWLMTWLLLYLSKIHNVVFNWLLALSERKKTNLQNIHFIS